MTTNLVIKTDTKTNISFKLDPITHILNISTLKSKAFVQIIPELSVVVKGNSVTLIKNEGLVTCGNRKNLSQIFKTTATLIKNHIRGLSQPFKVYLQLNGLGFKAKISMIT
jgi:ribosomal protein L6P/L9E